MSTTKSKSNDRLSYGVSILIFGILFLLDKIGILSKIPYNEHFISIGSFLLIGGIVFLATQPKKILGWIFLIIGILLNADLFFGWVANYSNLVVPIALIIVGIAMVLTSRKNN